MQIPDSERQKSGFFAGWSRVFTYGVLQAILALSFYAASCDALQSAFALDYGLLIITGTLGMYNSHSLIKTFLEQRRWPIPHIFFLLILALFALYQLLNFKSGIEYLSHLLIPVIISVLYLIPFSKIINSRFIAGCIKPASLALAWTWTCVGPVNYSEIQTNIFSASVFFLIFANALIFDVKDMETDKRLNKSTFANRYGWKFTQRTAFISLIISMILIGIFYRTNYFAAFSAPAILGLYFIPLIKIKTDSPQNHYYWYLDGGLFLFPCAVYLIQLVSDKL